MKKNFTVYCEECDAKIRVDFDDEDAIFDFCYQILCPDCEDKWIKAEEARIKTQETPLPCEFPF